MPVAPRDVLVTLIDICGCRKGSNWFSCHVKGLMLLSIISQQNLGLIFHSFSWWPLSLA